MDKEGLTSHPVRTGVSVIRTTSSDTGTQKTGMSVSSVAAPLVFLTREQRQWCTEQTGPASLSVPLSLLPFFIK